jgi:hypothetical protein
MPSEWRDSIDERRSMNLRRELVIRSSKDYVEFSSSSISRDASLRLGVAMKQNDRKIEVCVTCACCR